MVWPIIDFAFPHEEIKFLFHSPEESNSALANLLPAFGANTQARAQRSFILIILLIFAILILS